MASCVERDPLSHEGVGVGNVLGRVAFGPRRLRCTVVTVDGCCWRKCAVAYGLRVAWRLLPKSLAQGTRPL